MLVKNINIRIQEALKARERALARINQNTPTEAKEAETPKGVPNLSDISSRSTFVRMVSNKEIPVIIQGGKLAKNLNPDGTDSNLATQFGFKNVYKTKSDKQIRPLSGIKDISVEYTGGYSAIRKAAVNWKASSLDDLNSLAPHFLNIGNSVLLDWGWVYKRAELNQYQTFYDDGVINPTLFSNPMNLIYEADGSYDAIGGTVSNFEYKLTEDGGFDCTTHITSIGINLFNGTRVDKGSGDFVPSVGEDGKSTEVHSDDLISALINLPIILDNLIKSDKVEIHPRLGTKEVDGNTGLDNSLLFSSANNQIFKCMLSGRTQKVKTTYSRTDYYVKWGWLEDNIFSRYSSYINNKNEILSAIRSIESELDPKGDVKINEDGSVDYRSVLIRNNSSFLIPRDPMKFFLPGQNINPKTVASLDEIEQTFLGFSFGKKMLGVGLGQKSQEVFESFLKINSDSENAFADENNKNYGRIRNIMVNVDEVQKAFGIKPSAISSATIDYHTGKIYGTDVVTNPPSDIKSGIKRLLSALNQNFYGFWNFDISQDPLSFNIKVIDTHATSQLNEKAYTRFTENSYKVSKNGMYKFPAYKLGSMVKSQDLSFKIPDSMAVTAAYGSNKNMAGGIRIDTTNTYPELETFFENDGDIPDSRLDGLQKAFRANTGDGHKVGNSSGNPDSSITKEGSFIINPNAPWWSKWTEKSNSSVEKPKVDSTDETAIKERKRLDDFKNELHLLILGDDQTLFENNRQIYEDQAVLEAQLKEAKNILYDKRDPNSLGFEEEDDMNPNLTSKELEAVEAIEAEIEALNNNLMEESITNIYYSFVHDSENRFRIELFSAGEAVLRAKLFNFDKRSNLYQTNWLIPAELNLEVDGIAGITPGDILQTDYILPRYNQEIKLKDSETILGPRTFFQTFGLTQRVDDSGWTTEITTKMRMNNSVLEKKGIEIFVPKQKEVPTETVNEEVPEELIVETVYGCMDDTPGTNVDINGELLTEGVELTDPAELALYGLEAGAVRTFYGYKALNFNPEATIQQVSEEDMSNPCTYLEPQEEPVEDTDLQYNLQQSLDPPERRNQPVPIKGCVDQLANNYIFEDDNEPDGYARVRHPETGELHTLVELVEKNIYRVISAPDEVPCLYDAPEPPETEQLPVNVSSDNYEPLPKKKKKKSKRKSNVQTNNNSNIASSTIETPIIVDVEREYKQPASDDLSSEEEGFDVELQIDELELDEFDLPKPDIYGCLDPAATNFGLDIRGNVIDEKDYDRVVRKMGYENPTDPCNFPVPEPVVEKGIKCTEEELKAGYQSKYGHINLQKGGQFKEYSTDLVQVEITTGPNAGSSFELQWYCIPPEEKKTPKVKIISNEKKENTKKAALVNTNPKPKKLFSTYRGTSAQNYNFLYKVTPWYAKGEFLKISWYGEGWNEQSPWKDGRHSGRLIGNAVSFWIRKKFWDEYIEQPNETGETIYKTVTQANDGFEEWKDKTGLFKGNTLPTYKQGVVQGNGIDWLPIGKAFSGPNPTARYPKNGLKGDAMSELGDKPIEFSDQPWWPSGNFNVFKRIDE